MNKTEFITQLKTRLKKLPEDEVTNAITYYEEYFNEAGVENEEKVLEELESPANVASQIIANYVLKEEKNSTKKDLSVIWMVIFAILASPIALPLALLVISLALAVVLVIFSLLLTFGVAGGGLLIGGVIYAILSLFLLIQHFATGLLFLGLAFVIIGIGILFLKFTIYMSKKSFRAIANQMSQFLLRRSVK